ncbi:MAG: hypothetical protein P8Z35_03265 [Ignavibacteriaceae bacterium]
MIKTIKILLMIILMLSFFSCSNDKTTRDVKVKTDSLNTEPKKPKNFESIQQREWEEHRKDTSRNSSKDTSPTIIKYKSPKH